MRRSARHGQFRELFLPVGSWLKGTSLSTRTSGGRPSTRSAMMLRMISSVPPAMREDGEVEQASSKMAATGPAPGRWGCRPAHQVHAEGKHVLQLVAADHLAD